MRHNRQKPISLTCQLARQRNPESAKRADPSSENTVRTSRLTKVAAHNNMVAPSFLDHIRHQFCRDRCSTLVLLVLSRIWEQRNDCRNPLSARNLACMNHNAQFHERRVYCTTSSVDNIDVEFSHRFCDSDIGLSNTTLCYIRLGKWNADAAKYQARVRINPKALEAQIIIGYRRAIISASSGWLVPTEK